MVMVMVIVSTESIRLEDPNGHPHQLHKPSGFQLTKLVAPCLRVVQSHSPDSSSLSPNSLVDACALCLAPKLVRDLCQSMADVHGRPVTVKCRVGVVDKQDMRTSLETSKDYEALASFVHTITEPGSWTSSCHCPTLQSAEFFLLLFGLCVHNAL